MKTLLTKTNVYILIFLIIAFVYLGWVVVQNVRNKTEHFVSDDYQSRMYVMKVFDLVLNRNPTPEEIEKYVVLGNEQDILVAVLKDFNKTQKNTIEEEMQRQVVEEDIKSVLPVKETFDDKSNKVCLDKAYIRDLLDDLTNKINTVRMLIE